MILSKIKADVEAKLGEKGRSLVRASGTEALVRGMVEAESEKEAQEQASALAEIVRLELK